MPVPQPTLSFHLLDPVRECGARDFWEEGHPPSSHSHGQDRPGSPPAVHSAHSQHTRSWDQGRWWEEVHIQQWKEGKKKEGTLAGHLTCAGLLVAYYRSEAEVITAFYRCGN